jgi:hypothetical protein
VRVLILHYIVSFVGAFGRFWSFLGVVWGVVLFWSFLVAFGRRMGRRFVLVVLFMLAIRARLMLAIRARLMLAIRARLMLTRSGWLSEVRLMLTHSP